ncbi:dockerin type I repeat-containing protein [Ruminococcus flavefaciens]|uniref:Dockerin domain-containing protein n=1 Tax=Ruminococcus flavefaciens TaxID=1265 RepID=A0A1M7K4J7_RUMFL|nr:hypothetical protein SAMN04487860_107104 [Ruminococcus flavefaciens]
MKKMINILLTASMLASCIAVPFTAVAADNQTAVVQTSEAEENINISEKLKNDINAGLEKIDVMMWCTFRIDYSKIYPRVNKATEEYKESLDTSLYSAEEINEMVGAYKNDLSQKKYEEAYAAKTKEVCDFIGIDVSEANFTGTALRCSLTPEQIYKIAGTDLIKGGVIEQSEFVSGEELGYTPVDCNDSDITFNEIRVMSLDEQKALFAEREMTEGLKYRLWSKDDMAQMNKIGRVWVLLEANPFPVSNEALAEDYKVCWEDDKIIEEMGLPTDMFAIKQRGALTVDKGEGYTKYCAFEIIPITAQADNSMYAAWNYVQFNEYFAGFYYDYIACSDPPKENNDTPITTTTTLPKDVPITTTTVSAEVQEAMDKLNKYIEDNGLDAKCLTSAEYPSYYPPLVIEYVTENVTTEQKKQLIEFAEQNGIRELFTMVHIINGEKVYWVYDAINVKGDANCDGQADMADVVLIMQALANPNKYGENGTAELHLTAQGKANADMDGDGLTVGDAQAIQKLILNAN